MLIFRVLRDSNDMCVRVCLRLCPCLCVCVCIYVVRASEIERLHGECLAWTCYDL